MTEYDVSKFSKIAFPFFGLEVDPPRGFSLFGLNIQFYGVIIAIGLMLAVFYGIKRCRQFGLKQDDILDGVLWIVPFAIVCARAYYCIFEWDRYADDPISVLYIWKGGIAIYGGVIGAAIGVVVFSLIKKVRIGAVLDIVALGFLIGQSIGRWGNFFNREAFGETTDIFIRMGLYDFVAEKYTYFHPTFLYESLWNLVGFIALHFLSKKRQYDGQIALGYVFWYGLGRTFIEGLRTDSLFWGNFRVSQLLAACTCFVAAGALLILAFRKHDRRNLFVNIVAEREAEAAALAAAETEAAVAEVTEESEEAEDILAEDMIAEDTPAEEIPQEEPEETTEG
jgi:phosphatidylglycerol:prolipoprotein diacylglycerol transferase